MKDAVLESKKAVVSEIQEKMTASQSTVVVEYRGLTVAEVTELRRSLRAEGIEFKVYKNSMSQRAAEAAGFNELTEQLTGPNAIAFSDDAVAPSRVLAKFAKKHDKLVLKGAIVEGKVVGVDTIKELSSLPNRDGMLSVSYTHLDVYKRQGQSDAFNNTWAGVTEQVRAGVKQNLPPVNVEIDQNALVSAIGSALAEQGVAEEQIPDLTQAIAGKVGEQLNSQLGAAQEMIAAGLGQAVDAGVDTMSSYGKQAAVGTVDQIAQTVQDTMSAKVQDCLLYTSISRPNSMAFYMLGFILSVYLGLDTIVIAVLGFIIAWFYTQLQKENG